MRYLMLMAMTCALILTGGTGRASAQEKCPEFDFPNIEYTMSDGVAMQSQTKTAFELARQKAVKYGVKMPKQQGSIGQGVITAETKVDIETFPREGCVIVTGITFNVHMNHTFELAKEFEPGTCMQSEFYNLEMELRMQDQDYLLEAIKTIRQDIRDELAGKYIVGPIKAMNITQYTEQLRRDTVVIVDRQMEKMTKEIARLRQESDLPEFYEEIKADCNG